MWTNGVSPAHLLFLAVVMVTVGCGSASNGCDPPCDSGYICLPTRTVLCGTSPLYCEHHCVRAVDAG